MSGQIVAAFAAGVCSAGLACCAWSFMQARKSSEDRGRTVSLEDVIRSLSEAKGGGCSTSSSASIKYFGAAARPATILQRERMWTGKWLQTERLPFNFDSSSSAAGVWEMVSRPFHAPGRADGVDIVAFVTHKGVPTHVVMVACSRVPVFSAPVLEFPAGLVDEGEEPAVAGRRELLEETGFTGRVLGVSPVGYTDPWKSNETYQIVFVVIDGDDPRNADPTPEREVTESMQVVLVPLRSLWEHVSALQANHGWEVEGKVLSFVQGIALSRALAK